MLAIITEELSAPQSQSRSSTPSVGPPPGAPAPPGIPPPPPSGLPVKKAAVPAAPAVPPPAPPPSPPATIVAGWCEAVGAARAAASPRGGPARVVASRLQEAAGEDGLAGSWHRRGGQLARRRDISNADRIGKGEVQLCNILIEGVTGSRTPAARAPGGRPRASARRSCGGSR